MVNCSIENVDTVTDNAEYSTRSVSAREVGGRRVQDVAHWSESPNPHSGHGQLDRKATRGGISADLGRQNSQRLHCLDVA